MTIDWKKTGLSQKAPNGTSVIVVESEDGESYYVEMDTPEQGDVPASRTAFAISGGTLATMLVLIAKQGGLWMPGLGRVRAEEVPGGLARVGVEADMEGKS